jgi:hypothetical protein
MAPSIHSDFVKLLERLQRAGVPIQTYFRNHTAFYASIETFGRGEDELMNVVKEVEPKLRRIKELGTQLTTIGNNVKNQVGEQRRGFEQFKKDCRNNRWQVTEREWSEMNVLLNQAEAYCQTKQKTYQNLL